MKNDNIFKKGDRVFHFVFGWGSVTGDSEKGVCDVVFENRESVTIPCKEIHLSFCKYDLINGGLSHERPFGLEVGKSYMSKYNNVMIINRVGEWGNYGFTGDGDWRYDLPCITPDIWREASDEEVRSALEKETIRRFGENWKDVKIKRAIYDVDEDCINMGIYDSGEIDQDPDGWYVCGKNGHLFYKVVWAEKVEEDDRPLYFELEKSSGFDLDGILNENIICNDPESFTEAIKRLVSEKLEELELRPKFEVGELILVRDNDSEDWVTRFFDSYGEDYLITVGGDTWGQFMKFDEDFHNT